jgi:hypothetical protein
MGRAKWWGLKEVTKNQQLKEDSIAAKKAQKVFADSDSIIL